MIPVSYQKKKELSRKKVTGCPSSADTRWAALTYHYLFLKLQYDNGLLLPLNLGLNKISGYLRAGFYISQSIRIKLLSAALFKDFILATPLKIFSILIMLAMSVLYACSQVKQTTDGTNPETKKTGYQTYLSLQTELEACSENIDYDTLMQVYRTMVQSQHRIPHMDQLLYGLINKRNNNPRVDQMVLIFSARVIGNSKFQIPHAYDIFEAILRQDNNRINDWVLSFVAAGIGRYAFDMPKGDKLVDFLEQRQDQIDASTAPDSKEFFGYHFLPPPRNAYIIAYLECIEKQRLREFERAHYYALIQNDITENEIETALQRIRKNGMPGTGKPSRQPLKYLLANMNSLFPEVKKGR